MFVTDLNDRERRRHAASMRALSKAAADAADALGRSDDLRLTLQLLVINSVAGQVLPELLEALQGAVSAEVPDRVPDSSQPGEASPGAPR